MFETLITVSLVLAREGFESILLTGLIVSALPQSYRVKVISIFALTWLFSIAIGWQLIEVLSKHIEELEGIMMLVTSAVLAYIAIHSKKTFIYAKEITQNLSYKGLFSIYSLIFLIVSREGLETVVFMSSAILQNASAVVMGLAIGMPIIILSMIFVYKINVKLFNEAMFKYMSYMLLIFSAYYAYKGISEII